MKIVFWDLREPFIDNLYKHSVSQSRLESLIEALDVVSCFYELFISKFYIRKTQTDT